MIQAAVDAMGHLWHPTVGIDSGIDGQIELRDPATNEVRNVRIGVQSRANPSRWMRETERGFSYRPPPEELSYWLSSNQPILLICSRPESGEIYWRSIQEWVADPQQRAKGYIRFDKEEDRFDASSGVRLFDLKANDADRVEPPGPLPRSETVTTNLMPIEWSTPRLRSLVVPSARSARELFAPAWEQGLSHPAGALREGRFWSLLPISERFASAVGGRDFEDETLEFHAGVPRGAHGILKELVVRTVMARHDQLAWHAQKRVAYFRRRGDKANVHFQWTKGAPKTVVFANYSKGEDRHFTGYRHDAAELSIRDIGEAWALQVVPTYLFTWDGRQLSGHHASALAGIRRIEKHRSASATLRMWEHLLVDRSGLFADESAAGFTLSPLIQATSPKSIDERAWERLSDDDADEAQGSIFDVLEEPA